VHSYGTDFDRNKITLMIGAGSVGVAYLAYWAVRVAGVAVPWWIDIPGPLAIGAIVFGFYDRILWRTHLGRFCLSAIPDLSGTWEGVVKSDFDNGANEQRGHLRISQRWTTIRVHYKPLAGSSSSISVIAALLTADGDPTLVYEYTNEPEPLAISAMAPHRGLARLQYTDGGRLVGSYFTGRLRKTAGTMEFRRV
jgi:hypothetical protein